MPYTLVTPHYPPVCRPVLLLPTVLGRILDKKLAGWQGFQLCEPGEDRSSVTRCLCFNLCHLYWRTNEQRGRRHEGGDTDSVHMTYLSGKANQEGTNL